MIREFLWKHFIGSFLADAYNSPQVKYDIYCDENYTLLSEIVYLVIASILLYIAYRLLKKWNVKPIQIYSIAIPLSIFASFLRVFEDMQIVKPPLSFLFISPVLPLLIYFLFLIFIRHSSKNSIKNYSIILSISLILPCILIYSLNLHQPKFNTFTSLFLSLSISIIFYLLSSNIFYSFILFAHSFDALTTILSFPFYAEKHPIVATFNPLLYFILKIFLPLFLFYFSLKFTKQKAIIFTLIFIAGFSPALRNFLRVFAGA